MRIGLSLDYYPRSVKQFTLNYLKAKRIKKYNLI
jgi:hypothetical protein